MHGIFSRLSRYLWLRRKTGVLIFVLVFLLSVMVVFLPNTWAGSNPSTQSSILRLINLRTVGDQSRIRLISTFNRKPDFKLIFLDRPPRLIIDLPLVDFSAQKKPPIARGLLSSIRYGASGPQNARLIFTIHSPFKVERSKIEALNSGLWQLVIDIVKDDQPNFDVLLRAQFANLPITPPIVEQKKNLIPNTHDLFRVVLDPGHGGVDGGARGVGGVLEKNVTLAFAKTLRDELEKKSNIQVFMTRDDDVFLRLKERVEKAHDLKADLFISIHADSIGGPLLRGATVYTISDKASDAVTRDLAEHENKVDLLDGLPEEKAPQIADILIDLTRQETDAFSVNFANKILLNLSKSNIKLINNPHRFAGFRVLKAPDIPSVLLEMGYLSNKEDERLINDQNWRSSLAKAMAQAIGQFAAYREALASRVQN
ncbi:N-acetylmuramoyl-L-alanine amidase [Bartonella sp. DGB2]|uniref:N-acetylmuramoyl-L-alanine amidase n=1 Tax=Bartonella sp. DGB2 TaxID=3388426 RepID=UPI00398FBF14